MSKKNDKKKKFKNGQPMTSADFDKYDYYRRSVQSPDTDVIFLQEVYQELRNKKPKILREDFCGTYSILCEWVKLNSSHWGVGVDLDSEPTNYGRQNNWSQLKPSQQDRIKVLNENVLSSGLPQADIIAAMNFSYFIFKKREVMKKYFANTYSALNKNGLFIIDCFGGQACQEPNEEETVHKNFSYFWDQQSFDPITNHALFHIHFKLKGEGSKRKNVFTYDWRLWSIPELKDLMEEVGFQQTHVYWEGTTKSGDGNGEFTRMESTDEECEAWVAYIVGEK